MKRRDAATTASPSANRLDAANKPSLREQPVQATPVKLQSASTRGDSMGMDKRPAGCPQTPSSRRLQTAGRPAGVESGAQPARPRSPRTAAGLGGRGAQNRAASWRPDARHVPAAVSRHAPRRCGAHARPQNRAGAGRLAAGVARGRFCCSPPFAPPLLRVWG
jgi:hypothetical protein